MTKINTEEHKNIISLYETFSTTEIAQKYNVTRQTISNVLKNNNIKLGKHLTNNKKIENNEKIENMFSDGFSFLEISHKEKLSYNSVKSYFNRKKIKGRPGRKYKIYENFFETLDSTKCYILGLLAADGNVTKNKLNLTLKEEDEYILIKIAELIYKKDFKIYSQTIKNRKYKSIVISSKKIVSDLIKFNIIPNKTKIYKPSNIPEIYFNSFLRGYFDGDGSITIYEKENKISHCAVSIVGNYDFITTIHNKLNISSKIYKTCSSTVYEIKFSKKEDVIRFYNFIYKDSEMSLFLTRKYNKFRYIMEKKYNVD